MAPIRYHERPDDAEAELQTLVRSVALGNRVADIFISDEGDGAALDTYFTQADAWFGIPRTEAEPTLKQIHEQTADLSDLFDLPTGDLGNPDEILARANETLMQITLQSQQENRQLVDQVSTDALTGLSNRRALDGYVNDQFALASANNPVSVLFIDLDHFKRINDVHGHPFGDRMLVVFATTLSDAVGGRGTVFRYGGEEFAVVCPDTDRGAATQIAESARNAVESDARVSTDDGGAVTVTCSIGVATHGGETFETADQWLKAADESLYAAKSAGRNCVRAHWSLDKLDAA